MEITKQEAINILTIIDIIEKSNQLEILGYTFLRNSLLLEPIVKEYNKIFEFLKNQFKNKVQFDETKLEDKEYSLKIDQQFTSYIQENEELNKFLEEKVNIDFITFEVDKLKDEKFKYSLIKQLLGKIII